MSCKPYIPKYSIDFNKEREKIGLPVLNDKYKSDTIIRDTILSENLSENGVLPKTVA